MYLIDSNVFLEGFLEQKKANAVKNFLDTQAIDLLHISDFSLHSICVLLIRQKKLELLELFIDEVIVEKIKVVSIETNNLKKVIDNSRKLGLDFDDAYQYSIAKIYNLQIVSFDKDFDKTDIKRIEL